VLFGKIAGLVQLKSGDAISGIVSRRAGWHRFYRVEMAELHDAGTQTTTRADGLIWVPKSNVVFLQQLVRIMEDRSFPAEPARAPGPLTSQNTQPTRDAG
jgi:hypothetical protein